MKKVLNKYVRNTQKLRKKKRHKAIQRHYKKRIYKRKKAALSDIKYIWTIEANE